MNRKIIKQLSSMQSEIMALLEQKDNRWENTIKAYKLAWKADDFYNHLSPDEQMEQISFAMYYASVIGEISLAIMNHEVHFLKIAQETVSQIDVREAEFRARYKDLEPEIIKFGDVAGYKASRMYEAMQMMEVLKSNAALSLDFARIMCDVAGANDIESEGYQQYNRLYNLLAKFLKQPLRGYDENDFPSMSVDELEYIDAQIKVRERTELMAPFALTYLEMVRKKVNEAIAFKKTMFIDDNLPNE